jgi:hypothetical protein
MVKFSLHISFRNSVFYITCILTHKECGSTVYLRGLTEIYGMLWIAELIQTILWAGRSRNRVQFLAGEIIFTLLVTCIQTGSGAYSDYSVGTECSFPGDKVI